MADKLKKYLDPGQPIEARVNDLLSRMTLEEKFREINMVHIRDFIDDNASFSEELADSFFKGMGIGAVQDPRLRPEENAKLVNGLQKYLRGKTRLGIPALVVGECPARLFITKSCSLPAGNRISQHMEH